MPTYLFNRRTGKIGEFVRYTDPDRLDRLIVVHEAYEWPNGTGTYISKQRWKRTDDVVVVTPENKSLIVEYLEAQRTKNEALRSLKAEWRKSSDALWVQIRAKGLPVP